uniref:Fe(II)/2-oxoglutarate-dependent dioxygenase 2 n=1 Tax=Phlegmariurus tetrastichus TaxID=1263146 RepID=A0A8F1NN89_9TRAC|nr:Fe(II)/2-oxoglutarate-dependent dioxygenase 2 [Phlegmariurus tetrastichus]
MATLAETLLPAHLPHSDAASDPPHWSVQGLVEKGVKAVPEEYLKDFSPNNLPSSAVLDGSVDIPVIDFGMMQKGNAQELQKFFKAIDEWGFFQLVNHSLTPGLLNHALDLCKKFFNLPLCEKVHYFAPDPNKAYVGYGRVNPITETTTADWGDTLMMDADLPVSTKEKVDLTNWNQLPDTYRDGISKFAKETHNLGLSLLAILTQNLGIAPVEDSCGELGLQLCTNVYPPCPNPEIVMGLSAHSDPQVISLLIQDKPGLQVLKDGRWVMINPIDDAFVVNLGDQLEVLSNGRYKSVVHRVVASKTYTRYSLGSFLRPKVEAVIGPDPKLVDEQHPARYKQIKFGDFISDSLTYGFTEKRGVNSGKVDGET